MSSIEFTLILQILGTIAALLFHAPTRAFAADCPYQSSYPYFIYLRKYFDATTSRYDYTSAVVVGEYWAITTNQYFEHPEDLDEPSEYYVGVYEEPVFQKTNKIVEARSHYRYNKKLSINDLLVFKMQTSVGERAKLPAYYADRCGAAPAVLLHRHTPEGPLRCNQFDLLTMDECKKAGAFRAESVICAIPRNKSDEDIGNTIGLPLICEDDEETIIGILVKKFKEKWEGRTAFEFTRVSYYVEFIKMVMNDSYTEEYSSAITPKTNFLLFCFIYILYLHNVLFL